MSRKRRELKAIIKSLTIAGIMTMSLLAIPCSSINVQAASGTASELISLAASQVGYHEKASNADLDDYNANRGSNNYNKYARDVGVANGQPWCATFVWWCMKNAGVPDSSYPSRTTVTRDWFNQRGLFRPRGNYTPKPGDYVVFGNVAHCGIVESVSGSTVITIEGNSGDQVKRNTYSMSNGYILGYGIINYNSSSSTSSGGGAASDNPGSPYPVPTENLRSGSRGDSVKWVQKFANDIMGAGIDVDGIYGNQTTYAVRVFQQNNGLAVDGICGQQTTGIMLNVWRDTINKRQEAERVKHNPVGVVDAAQSTKDGKLYIKGWMYDPDAVTRSNVVHVYIGGRAGTAGAEGYAITANVSRKDVDNVYHVGEFHGFETVIDTKKTGTQEVYVYGINEGEGTTNPELGHKTVKLEKAVEPTIEEPKEEPKTEATTEEPKEEPKTEATTEEPKEEPKTEATTEEPKEELKTEATAEEPKEEPKTEATAEEPTEEPKTEATTEEPAEEPKTEEPTTEKLSEEPKTEAITDETTEESKSEEATIEEPAEEPKTETTTEESKEDPTHELNTEVETEKPKETPKTEKTTKVPAENDKKPTQINAAGDEQKSQSNYWSDCDDDIDLDAPIVSKLNNIKKRSLKIRIGAVKEVDGYEYTVAKVNNKTYKRFKKAVLNADVDGISFKGTKKYCTKSTVVKLSGLKKNKRYAVVVRAYKIVDGNKHYSDYSSVKCIKIKK